MSCHLIILITWHDTSKHNWFYSPTCDRSAQFAILLRLLRGLGSRPCTESRLGRLERGEWHLSWENYPACRKWPRGTATGTTLDTWRMRRWIGMLPFQCNWGTAKVCTIRFRGIHRAMGGSSTYHLPWREILWGFLSRLWSLFNAGRIACVAFLFPFATIRFQGTVHSYFTKAEEGLIHFTVSL